MRTKFIAVFSSVVLLSSASTAFARDERLMLPIDAALKEGEAKNVIGKDIRLYFEGAPSPTPKQVLGTFKSNRKTNAFGKSDTESCNWAFLSAVKSLQERSRTEGGNAVINIKSVYKGTVTSSSSKFMCGAGSIMSGVALEGKMAKL